MNRNNERHFAQIPQVHISRSTFNRPQNILTTFNAGELVPFYVDEVLFLGVPVFSVFYVLICDFVNRRLREKRMKIDS